jgi:hypothetical protein
MLRITVTLRPPPRPRGVELPLGVQELRLDTDVASCDVLDFEAAIADRNHERAADLYGGAFLDGFRVPGARSSIAGSTTSAAPSSNGTSSSSSESLDASLSEATRPRRRTGGGGARISIR